MASLPPCMMDKPAGHMVQTVVAKVDNASALATLGAAELVQGAGSFAVVQNDGNVRNDGNYFVVTTRKRRDLNTTSTVLKRKIEQLPGEPKVEWVRPLTRRLQRLFGWGDVAADRAAVARACKAGDTAELLAIMPEAGKIIARGDFEQLPGLHDALREPPALEDCKHDFGPEKAASCRNGFINFKEKQHLPPFVRCVICRVVYCSKCVRVAGEKQEEHEELQQAYHECREEHEWQVASSKIAACTLCGISRQDCECKVRGNEECTCGAKIMECKCGEQMCVTCIEASRPAPPSWRQHPMDPLPFYVIDQERVNETEKLAWMKQELGSDADLATFAAKFLELFGEKLKGEVPQKAACLKLFGAYSTASWKKESDLPPAELEAFQQVWGKAPARCRECNSSLPADTPFTMPYCSDTCREAGKRLSCWHSVCVDGPRCGGKVEIRDGCRVCTVCGNGADIAKSVAACRKTETSLDRSLKRSAEGLRIFSNMFGFTAEVDPDHGPAYTKRRRTAR